MCLNLQESAIFIADTHYNEKNQILESFLIDIKSGKIKTSQLILMGDIFDFLTFQTKYFIKKNKGVIELINELALSIEITYLEGNHDYNIQKIFPNIRIYTRAQQPIDAKYKDKTIQIAHGDLYVGKVYDIYCSIIRNRILLSFINLIDRKDKLASKIYYSLMKKSICHKIKDFKSLIGIKINNYSSDIVIEGHYHQGDQIEYENRFYINIPSLLCSNEYVLIKEGFIKTKYEKNDKNVKKDK
ncbi:MAG: UDP-2,3-diacylglucosamine diphosphatase [Campylobacteraceae bacterium]|nr:UDP-2,3-diacylglucosamine diphosphatase [Campylobacteraceae bacterium]